MTILLLHIFFRKRLTILDFLNLFDFFKVLCSFEISNLLKCQFLVWAWDVTQEQNRQTLFEWMNLANLGNVVEVLRVSGTTGRYPLLIVLCKDRGSFQQSTFIYG